MTDPLLVSLLATAFVAAFIHAVLPTHWLPFVLVGRGQGWSAARTLGAAALSGTAHVVVTIVAGILVVVAGVELDRHFHGILPAVSAAILAMLGLYFFLTRAKHLPGEDGARRRYGSDRAALLGLVALLAVYPSEAFLPVYLSAAPLGWGAFVILSVILAAATLIGMMLFTGLALLGATRLRLERWERYERVVLSIVLFALAAVILVWRP